MGGGGGGRGERVIIFLMICFFGFVCFSFMLLFSPPPQRTLHRQIKKQDGAVFDILLMVLTLALGSVLSKLNFSIPFVDMLQ